MLYFDNSTPPPFSSTQMIPPSGIMITKSISPYSAQNQFDKPSERHRLLQEPRSAARWWYRGQVLCQPSQRNSIAPIGFDALSCFGRDQRRLPKRWRKNR
jgi:hypothetical protein